MNFFYTDENGNIINNNSRYILENKKDIFTKKYTLIIKKIAVLEEIIKKVIVLTKFKNYKGFDKLLQQIIINAKTIKININNLSNWINNIGDKIKEYYDLLLLSSAYRIKVKNYEEQLMKDEKVLAFEKIFEDWKKLFDNNYIKELKKNNDIDETKNFVD